MSDNTEAKHKDMELFQTWKKSKSKSDLGALVNHLQPLMYSEVKKLSGTLPESALLGEAKKWTVKAITTFDDTKGARLSTYVVNYLPKVKRMNYTYQNAARLPENLHLEWSTFNRAKSHLEEALSRDPTDDEMAKHLGWSTGSVIKFKGRLYEDLSESAASKPIETTQFNHNRFLLDHIREGLDPQQLFILDNKNVMSNTDMAEKLGVNISRLNYMQSKLIADIHAKKAEIGMY